MKCPLCLAVRVYSLLSSTNGVISKHFNLWYSLTNTIICIPRKPCTCFNDVKLISSVVWLTAHQYTQCMFNIMVYNQWQEHMHQIISKRISIDGLTENFSGLGVSKVRRPHPIHCCKVLLCEYQTLQSESVAVGGMTICTHHNKL